MAYINVGAYVNGERPRTKKALREALASAPNTVRFDQTSNFRTGSYELTNTVDQLRAGDTFTVVGPDPYTSRKWYASVTRDRDGKVKIQ